MQMSRAAAIKPSASLRGDEIAGQLQAVQAFLEKTGDPRQWQTAPAIDPELQAFPEFGGDNNGNPA